MLAFLILAAWGPCAPDSEPTAAAPPTAEDHDGDGYDATADCDDNDAAVSPGARESCNEVDDDCDGTVDEEPEDGTVWYPDADGDGYGRASADPVWACAQPAEFAAGFTDCDDSNAAIHPDAVETDCADPVDYNCDGSTGFEDADGDGWAACDDCADNDAGRSPDQAEVCDAPNVDEDCDGRADDADPSATGQTAFAIDDDGDGFGSADDTVFACDEPTGTPSNTEDCDDDAAKVNPDSTESCHNRRDDDCNGLTDEGCTAALYAGDYDAVGDASVAIIGDGGLAGNGELGTSLVGGFDFDGDGVEDLAASALSSKYGAATEGATYLFTGGIPVSSAVSDAASGVLHGESAGESFGTTVWGINDLDGDGVDELAYSKPSATLIVGGAVVRGDVGNDIVADSHLISLAGAAGSAGHHSAPSGDNEYLLAEHAGSAFEVYDGDHNLLSHYSFELDSHSCGQDALTGGSDVNGDGYDEVLAGACAFYGAGNGALYVVLGPTSGLNSLAAADLRVTGAGATEGFGSDADFIGDSNGDGYADAVIGAVADSTLAENGGAIFLFETLDPSGAAPAATSADAVAAVYGSTVGGGIGGLGPISGLGTTVGDVDGDGIADLLVEARDADVGSYAGAGSAFLFYGPLDGSYDVADPGDYHARFDGAETNSQCGGVAASDLDGDGADEVILSCLGVDDAGLPDVGVLLLFPGG